MEETMNETGCDCGLFLLPYFVVVSVSNLLVELVQTLCSFFGETYGMSLWHFCGVCK